MFNNCYPISCSCNVPAVFFNTLNYCQIWSCSYFSFPLPLISSSAVFLSVLFILKMDLTRNISLNNIRIIIYFSWMQSIGEAGQILYHVKITSPVLKNRSSFHFCPSPNNKNFLFKEKILSSNELGDPYSTNTFFLWISLSLS